MSGYDVEHSIDRSKDPKPSSKRPDMSSFFALAGETFPNPTTNNPHATATPANVTALNRMLADAYEMILTQHMDNPLLRGLIEELDEAAHDPSQGEQGMPETFFVDLDRIDKKKLKEDETCPICSEPFLDDPYPLVVRLPCHPDHKFDLECIRTWLTVKTTCPLDRQSLLKKKEPPPKDEDDEEDYDPYYA